jgi:glycogen debranching enzyme
MLTSTISSTIHEKIAANDLLQEKAGREATLHALALLTVKEAVDQEEAITLYKAAYPGYPEQFPRDSIIALSLWGNAAALKDQIAYSAHWQGKRKNPWSGEEPGKIHHQMPGVKVEFGHGTTDYNACDTTALFLESIAVLAENGDSTILSKYHDNIERGITYIKSHVRRGLFYEDPSLAGAKKFSLRVTYWKDSILNDKSRQEPHGPIIYSLAHFQNAHALERIGASLGRMDLVSYGRHMMKAGIEKLWEGDHFVTAIDEEGKIDSLSSDSLHALLYIPPSELPRGYAQKIEHYMEQLETPAGYRTGIPEVPGTDPYHTGYVWTHEQALLDAAAKKHHLERADRVADRVVPYIHPVDGIFPELIDAETGEPAGNRLQLWAMGAYLYFQNPERALL